LVDYFLQGGICIYCYGCRFGGSYFFYKGAGSLKKNYSFSGEVVTVSFLMGVTTGGTVS